MSSYARDDRQGEETDGVLAQHAETETGANRHPPARIAGANQANDEVGGQHPGQAIEGHVLHLVSAAQAERDSGYSSDELCPSASPHLAGHQAGEHHGNGLRNGGEEAEAAN